MASHINDIRTELVSVPHTDLQAIQFGRLFNTEIPDVFIDRGIIYTGNISLAQTLADPDVLASIASSSIDEIHELVADGYDPTNDLAKRLGTEMLGRFSTYGINQRLEPDFRSQFIDPGVGGNKKYLHEVTEEDIVHDNADITAMIFTIVYGNNVTTVFSTQVPLNEGLLVGGSVYSNTPGKEGHKIRLEYIPAYNTGKYSGFAYIPSQQATTHTLYRSSASPEVLIRSMFLNHNSDLPVLGFASRMRGVPLPDEEPALTGKWRNTRGDAEYTRNWEDALLIEPADGIDENNLETAGTPILNFVLNGASSAILNVTQPIAGILASHRRTRIPGSTIDLAALAVEAQNRERQIAWDELEERQRRNAMIEQIIEEQLHAEQEIQRSPLNVIKRYLRDLFNY